MKNNLTENKEIKMETNFVKISAKEFKLEYEISNKTEKTLFLFTNLFHINNNGYYYIDTSLFYTIVEKNSLIVAKKLIPIPPGFSVEFPEIPCVRELKPSKSLKEKIIITFPLIEKNPYVFLRPKKTIERAEITQIKLQIGYIENSPHIHWFEGKDIRGILFRYPDYDNAIKLQKFIETDWFKL